MSISVHRNLAILLACLVSVIVGCGASVPVVRAWRPWVQTNREAIEIPLRARLLTAVSGETQPLVGDEKPREETIKSELNRLLVRRGFLISDSAFEFKVHLKYKTMERDKLSIESWTSMSYVGSQGVFGGFTRSRNWGATLAGVIAGNAMSAVSSHKAQKTTMYVHVLGLEMSRFAGDVIWKSDAMWDAQDPNISANLTTALQTILINMPSDAELIPQVPEVDDTRALNFRRLYTDGKWFSCPALPFATVITNKTRGQDTVVSNYDAAKGLFKNEVPDFEARALVAFVDLVQTAEVALPLGLKALKDPLNQDNWSAVMLGGRYRLLPSNDTVSVLMKLKGNQNGYLATNCWIASDDKYTEFLRKVSQWKQAVADYADVFKKQ